METKWNIEDKVFMEVVEPTVYTFMNKKAVLFSVEMEQGRALKIYNVRRENLHLFPLFFYKNGQSLEQIDMVGAFNRWWSGRKIPASRDGVKSLLWELEGREIKNLEHLAEKALGLSLSDQYWLCPDEKIKWENVNFFSNPFSDDIGDLLVEGNWHEGAELRSPDNTSDGVIKKRWKIIDEQRFLLKSSTGVPWQAQPRREVLASEFAQVLLKPFNQGFYVPYYLQTINEEEFCICPNFVTTETEYVPFNQLIRSKLRKEPKFFYQVCLQYYKGFEYVLELTLILDYIILNEDRHTGNFGLIRSVNTGEIIRPAPIFDTGSSLFHNSLSTVSDNVMAKPFYKNHEAQIELVEVSKYRESLELLQESAQEIFERVFWGSNEGEERIQKMRTIVEERINGLLQR